MNPAFDEITVVRAGALGDVVLALPAVAALRAAFPRARLRAVGYPTVWEIAGRMVDGVQSIDGAAMSGLLTGVSGSALREAIGSSDLVVAWTRHDPTPVLSEIGIPHILHVPPIPPPGMHAAAWLLGSISELLADCPAPTLAESWRLRYTDGERRAAEALIDEMGLAGAVLLHPGAGAAWKCWPAERFAAVGEALRERGRRVALIEGPADRSAVTAVQARANRPFPVLAPLPVRSLGAILTLAPCYVGNDSGVTHLAGASGTPAIALFGPTDPASWRPLGDAVILRHCTRATREGHGIRVCDDPACLLAIGVEDVLAAVEAADVHNHVENRRKGRRNGW